MKLAAIALCGASMFVLAAAAKAETVDPAGDAAGSGAVATANPQSAADSGAGGVQVNEIIVQAQRRSERLQDVPITITNISSEQLKNIGAASLSDVVQLTPALRFDDVGPFVQPTIRGVGTDLVGQATGSNVGIYIDGFYNAAPALANFQLLNVSNVEVLKGPQGTLFGRNTAAGAILITTTKPSQDTHAIIEGQYGSYNAGQVSFYGTTGFGDRFAFDLAGIYASGDGYTKDIVTGSHRVGAYTNWSIRPGFLINFTPDFSLLFRYMHSDVNDPTDSLYNTPVVNGVPQSIGFIFPGDMIATKPNTVATGFPGVHIHLRNDTYQLTLSADLHFATLTSYTQYGKHDDATFSSLTDAGPIDVAHTLFTADEEVVTQEFLLASKPGGPLQWTGGFFYIDHKQALAADFAFGPVVPTAANFAGGSSSEDVSYAAYFDATYQLFDNLFLTGGLRYTHDEVIHIINDQPSVGPTPFPNLSSDTVTPRAVIRYQLNRESNVYFSYAQGFKAQVPDLGDPSPNPVAIKPEQLTAYEIGYKYAASAVSFSLSAYYYDRKEIQVTNLVTEVINGVTNQEQLTRNAASATVYGVEGQVNYNVTRDFNVNAGAAWTHSRFDKFPNAPGNFQCLDFVSGCAGSPPNFPGYFLVDNININAAGFSTSRSPDFTAQLGARYTHELFGGEIALSGNLYYTSKFFLDVANQYPQGAYSTLALRAQWTDPSKTYTIAVFGDNVTNSHYLTQLQESIGVGTGWSKPATVGVSLRVNLR